jgi:hypothetical protein
MGWDAALLDAGSDAGCVCGVFPLGETSLAAGSSGAISEIMPGAGPWGAKSGAPQAGQEDSVPTRAPQRGQLCMPVTPDNP